MTMGTQATPNDDMPSEIDFSKSTRDPWFYRSATRLRSQQSINCDWRVLDNEFYSRFQITEV